MRSQCLRRPNLLVAAGLFGIAAFSAFQRFHPPALLASDFVQGVWCGGCIGLELVGLIFLKRGQSSRLCPISLRDKPVRIDDLK